MNNSFDYYEVKILVADHLFTKKFYDRDIANICFNDFVNDFVNDLEFIEIFTYIKLIGHSIEGGLDTPTTIKSIRNLIDK